MTSGNNPMSHRRAVGPPKEFDIIGALQFMLLVNLGLRDTHYLLDIGCGSLRAGKLLIPYLNYGRYVGIEPKLTLVQAGISEEMGYETPMAFGATMEGPKGSLFWDISNFDLSYTGLKYDFILAHSIFTHAPRVMIEKCLVEAYRVMHKDSFFAFTFKSGDDWFPRRYESGPGTKMATFSSGTMASMVRKAELYPTIINWPHPYNQTWVLASKSRSLFPRNHFIHCTRIHAICNGG